MRKLLFTLLFLSSTSYGASVTLQWDPPANATEAGLTHYNIEQKAAVCGGAGAFAEVAQVPAPAITFLAQNLVVGTNYCWRVLASNGTTKSPPSNTIGQLIATPVPVPGAPINLRITLIGLTWDSNGQPVVAEVRLSAEP